MGVRIGRQWDGFVGAWREHLDLDDEGRRGRLSPFGLCRAISI